MRAISRKQRRDSLNFLRVPRALPVSWQRLRKRTREELRDILLRVLRASSFSSSLLFKSRIVVLSCFRLSQFIFTRRSRRFCFAIADFVAMIFLLLSWLFFAGWTLLSLFAVWIDLVDHINPSASSHDLISFGGIGFHRGSHFHMYLNKNIVCYSEIPGFFSREKRRKRSGTGRGTGTGTKKKSESGHSFFSCLCPCPCLYPIRNSRIFLQESQN